MTRQAISPRLAIRILENIHAILVMPDLIRHPPFLSLRRNEGGPRIKSGVTVRADHSAATLAGSSLSIGINPSFSNRAASAFAPALPVVSSLSPVKMLLA